MKKLTTFGLVAMLSFSGFSIPLNMKSAARGYTNTGTSPVTENLSADDLNKLLNGAAATTQPTTANNQPTGETQYIGPNGEKLSAEEAKKMMEAGATATPMQQIQNDQAQNQAQPTTTTQQTEDCEPTEAVNNAEEEADVLSAGGGSASGVSLEIGIDFGFAVGTVDTDCNDDNQVSNILKEAQQQKQQQSQQKQQQQQQSQQQQKQKEKEKEKQNPQSQFLIPVIPKQESKKPEKSNYKTDHKDDSDCDHDDHKSDKDRKDDKHKGNVKKSDNKDRKYYDKKDAPKSDKHHGKKDDNKKGGDWNKGGNKKVDDKKKGHEKNKGNNQGGRNNHLRGQNNRGQRR